MRHFPILPPLLLLLATLLLSAVARADSVNVDGNKYEGTIVGIKSGRLAITIRNTEHEYDLDKIADVVIDAAPKFADAEKARDTDPKAAAALYKQVIPALNKPELKQFAQWRAIAPTDADNRWTEAVQLFLDVYRASPTDFIYKSRPTHMPNAGSAMLAESADKVAAAAKAAKSDDVRKNLKLFLLDIYTKAGNTDAANRLAREISTGIAEDAAPPKPAENPIAASGSAAVTEIETALRSKNYDAALKQADAQLATATGDTAVQLFTLKAQAYEAQNNLEGALAALLRIPAHYPDSPAAPAALLHAADLDKKLNHPAAAAALTTELLEKFPSSPEALSARQK